jgi:catechol 2,3-dioxygenase-like lactoylglutathione lyase family enzyme
MFDHVSVGITDLARSAAFYDAVLATLGHGRLFGSEDEMFFAYGRSVSEPFFEIIAAPLDPERGVPAPNNGAHFCFRAATRDQVNQFHAVALQSGGTDAGGPGLRPWYTPDYYAAFVFDPDGHKIEAVTYAPE